MSTKLLFPSPTVLKSINELACESGITPETNTKMILDGITPFTANSVLNFTYATAFSVGCSLYIDFIVDWERSRKEKKKSGLIYSSIRVQLVWSSAYRSVANAQACIALYQKMTNFGAIIASKYEGVDITFCAD